jgi:hypothetical protein
LRHGGRAAGQLLPFFALLAEVSWLTAREGSATPVGDHLQVIGEIGRASAGSQSPPLIYHDGAYRTVVRDLTGLHPQRSTRGRPGSRGAAPVLEGRPGIEANRLARFWRPLIDLTDSPLAALRLRATRWSRRRCRTLAGGHGFP